jgi:hypothetical protein
MAADMEEARREAERRRRVREAAIAAREEAEARRAAAAAARPLPAEIDGPEGPEPTRYGDWEKKGIVSDF